MRKHIYKDCVFEWDNPYGTFDHDLGYIPKREVFGGSYCTICGKIGNEMSFKWYELGSLVHGALTQRGMEETDSTTRTLPTFHLDNRWEQKYITLGVNSNAGE